MGTQQSGGTTWGSGAAAFVFPAEHTKSREKGKGADGGKDYFLMSSVTEDQARANGSAPKTYTPADIAQRHGLKRQIVGGKTEWHGPNPSGHGATTDGFILNADGTSFDRSQDRRYTTPETAHLFSIRPEDYEPFAQWQERQAPTRNGSVPKPKRPEGEKPRPTKYFDYTDGDGGRLFQTVRLEFSNGAKKFSQRRPDGDGGWIWNLDGVSLVLYGLPQVLDAATVHIFEGEGCADAFNAALKAAGMFGEHVATTAPLGAGKWRPEYSEDLNDKRVILYPDKDPPGARHVATAAPSIAQHAASLQVIELPGLPEHGDVVDFLKAGHTVEQVLDLAQDAPEWNQNEPFVGFVGSVSKESAQNEPQFDGAPRPLTINLRPVPALTPEMLPGRLRDWVADIAERQSVPYEFPAVAALVALASLVGRKIGIRPKQHDDWTVTPNLWGALVGPPGLQKTPAAEEGLKPVRRLAAEALERYKAKSEDFKAEVFLNSVVSEQSKNNLKAAVKSGKTSAQELRNLSQKAVAEDDTPAPTCRRYMVNDATLEALCVVLQENPNGVLVQRDELTAFLRTLDKPGHESDRGFYLEAWNGTGDFMIDRIGRGIGIYLPAVCVSLLGTIQPGPLARYIRGASSGEGADGLVQRFQLMVYPDPTPYKLVDRYADTQAKNSAYDLFKLLDDINPAAVGAQLEEGNAIPFLRFAPDAQILFNEWREDLETQKLRSGESPVIEAHLSKYRSLMPSLALLFHLIESVEEGKAKPVSLRAAKMAAAWCDFLEEHARRIYQSAFDGDPEPAMRLAERIRLQLPNPCKVRDIIRRGWEGLTTAEDVERALGLLEEAGWLKVVETMPERGTGRPSRLVYFNPLGIGNASAKGAK